MLGDNNHGQLVDQSLWIPVDVVGFGGGETYVVTGSVKDRGRACIAAVTISGGGRTTTTDSGGGYALEGCRRHTYVDAVQERVHLRLHRWRSPGRRMYGINFTGVWTGTISGPRSPPGARDAVSGRAELRGRQG